MTDYIYTLHRLNKAYAGGREVLKDVTLSFLAGAKIGILGGNGAGKSTLMKIIAGLDDEYSGEARAADGILIGYLPQEPELDNSKTVGENVAGALQEAYNALEQFNAVSMKMGEVTNDDEMNALIDQQADWQEKIDALDAWDIERTLEIAMDALQCPPADNSVENLSGGEKRRVALCRLLLQKPDFLLLDEPTNHLDALSVAWLERHLRDYAGTVMMVTHDRYFLDNVTGWILELDRGHAIPYEGNYSNWLEQKEKRLRQESKGEEARARQLADEREWIRQTPAGRQTKSKARVQAYEDLLQQQSDKLQQNAQIMIPPAPRLGNKVVDANHLNKGFTDKLLIEDLNFKLPPGGIVGVIGANGAGKTTLFKMITGKEQPDNGTLAIGDSVQLGYVDQSRDGMDNSKTIWEEISGGQDMIDMGKRQVQSRAYVGGFGFRGADQQKRINQLSGGERNRVQLAKILKSGANLLLLDEPTNDLDVETLRALEEALLSFAGCAVVISHDRFFLDKIATHILAFEGDAKTTWFEGNYQFYITDRKKRLGIDENETERFRYKKLT
nr:energy-dependent translational throttle protein EttA [Alphaproteobacteria bacterium]